MAPSVTPLAIMEDVKSMNFLCCFYCRFVNALVYYGISLNTSNLGGSPYWNCFIAGAVEIPAYALVILAMNVRLAD